jgi:hypothetical protein
MTKHKEIDPEFYETHCFADDLVEASRNGDLLRPHSGKNAVEVMREHILSKKKGETVSPVANNNNYLA